MKTQGRNVWENHRTKRWRYDGKADMIGGAAGGGESRRGKERIEEENKQIRPTTLTLIDISRVYRESGLYIKVDSNNDYTDTQRRRQPP